MSENEIPFSQDLYNHLTTLLGKSIGLSLDARQIDRLNFEANKLANVIEKHVNKTAQERSLKVCALVMQEIDKLKAEIKQQREIDLAEAERLKARAEVETLYENRKL